MKPTKLKILGLILAGILGIILIFFLWPLPKQLQSDANKEPTRILDRNGKLLYESRDENFGLQEYLAFQDIPEDIIKIAVAVEDGTFYKHIGISLKGITRAAWQNFLSGKIVSGGSTITQQLIRNRLNPEHRGYIYKTKEILLALKLETRMSKDEIMESYLNSVYFGHQAYGVQAAAKTYFNKNAGELSLAESSFLLGLIQSPTSYDPFKNFDLAKKRHETVIGILEKAKTFSDDEISEIKNESINLSSGKIQILAPHFVMWVLERLHSEAHPQRSASTAKRIHSGAEIKTTLDLDLQSEAERIIENRLKDLADKNVTSAAAVVLDAVTGEVLAMVGSGDYFDAEHDGAVNVALSSRQPGSALKPFTYALALKRGATAATTVSDIETQFFTQEGNPYIPRNYDFGYHGLVRYREALANSYNICAVKVLEKVGVQTLLDFLKSAGINTLNELPEHYGLALTLGSGEVKLLELTKAYAMFARGGKTLEVKTLLDEIAPEGKRILDDKIAWLITDILDDDSARLSEFGEAGPLEFGFPVAAKTGTTRNSRDNWTIGYTPDRVVGVWVGNADNSPMTETSGVTGAGPIFHEIMVAATKNRPVLAFNKPEGVYEKEICKLSGKLPTDYCAYKIKEWFIAGTEPKEADNIFTPIKIDKRNGLMAGDGCPAEFMEEKVFAIFPPDLKTWARENGWMEPPRAYSPLCPEKVQKQGSWIMIEKPSANESYKLDPMVPDANEKIIFQASASDDISKINWFVNGENAGESLAPKFRLEWQPKAGDFTVKAVADNQKAEEKVVIEVINN